MTERPILFSAVEGYEGRYQVSPDGSVQSTRAGREIAKTINNCGYVTVLLCKDGSARRHLVHRLVALAFIPNPDAKKFVNHLDGNKKRNQSDNLEWVTQSENEMHAFALGLKRTTAGVPLSDAVKAKISAALIGRASPCGFRGKRRTPEAIEKFKNSMRARKENRGSK